MSKFQHRKLIYTVAEASEILSLSRTQIYRLIDLLDLETVKIGKSRRVTHAQIDAFVQRVAQRNGSVLLAKLQEEAGV